MSSEVKDTLYEWKDQYNEATDVRCLGWQYVGEADKEYDGHNMKMWHRLVLPNGDPMLMDHEWGPYEVPSKDDVERKIHAILEKLNTDSSIVRETY
jgi:hypothetical protein|tara:strand:+ start:166 stop:453 length:288 start_codon:yes stop_codon:yes gene_type:complete